jgi:hypothetical protein
MMTMRLLPRRAERVSLLLLLLLLMMMMMMMMMLMLLLAVGLCVSGGERSVRRTM